ncbi:MAG: EcsC family protein [Halobacteriovoraceae bacterium]|jgi:hypothetical protein|nr:EcsC family protein [Halobacteriovoraceae bacterium]
MKSQTKLSDDEIHFIKEAQHFLDSPSIALRVANAMGKPLDWVQEKLPEKHQQMVRKAVQKSLEKALRIAIRSVGKQRDGDDIWAELAEESNKTKKRHTVASGLTGGVGGFFGLLTLPVELPLTTGIIMRSIASIAQEFGADLNSDQVKLECLYIFTLGADKAYWDDEMDSSYYSSRVAFSKMIQEGAKYMAAHSAKELLKGVKKGSAPIIVSFISRVASYFEVAVTEKLLMEAVPIIGGVGGATINVLFTDYFSKAARYHFGLRNLEEKYGEDEVKKIFNHLSNEIAPDLKAQE